MGSLLVERDATGVTGALAYDPVRQYIPELPLPHKVILTPICAQSIVFWQPVLPLPGYIPSNSTWSSYIHFAGAPDYIFGRS